MRITKRLASAGIYSFRSVFPFAAQDRIKNAKVKPRKIEILKKVELSPGRPLPEVGRKDFGTPACPVSRHALTMTVEERS
jgi:hypothetical protein